MPKHFKNGSCLVGLFSLRTKNKVRFLEWGIIPAFVKHLVHCQHYWKQQQLRLGYDVWGKSNLIRVSCCQSRVIDSENFFFLIHSLRVWTLLKVWITTKFPIQFCPLHLFFLHLHSKGNKHNKWKVIFTPHNQGTNNWIPPLHENDEYVYPL